MKQLRNILSYIQNIRYLGAVFLVLIIALQSVYIVNIFFDEKTGYHCDEIYSYGLSNSFYEPYLQIDDVYADPDRNINEWVSGKIFDHYITVQKEQRFRYDSVWYNQSKDRHPPLYYACLHTICSFFPEQFSFLYGFTLNLVCFVVTQIFLYMLGKTLFHSRLPALLLCLLWGFSIGAAGLTVFIRMYSMLTMFTVMLLYFHAKLINEKYTDQPKWRWLLPLYIVTLAGGMTQYLFLVAAFLLTVLFCIRFIVKKQWKNFLLYGCTMLASVLTFFLIYPPALRQVFAETSSEINNFWNQFNGAVRIILYDSIGIGVSDIRWGLMVFPLLLLIALVFMIPIIFLFRKTAFIKKLASKIKSVPSKVRQLKLRNVFQRLRQINPMNMFMFLIAMIIIAVVAHSVSFINGYAERYLYFLMPIIVTIFVSLLYVLFKKNIFGKLLLVTVCLLLVSCSINRMNLPWMMSTKNTISLQQTLEDKNVVVLAQNEDAYVQFSRFSYQLCKTDHVFFTTKDDYTDYIAEIKAVPSDKELYVILRFISYDENTESYVTGYYADDNNGVAKVYSDDIMNRFSEIGELEFVGEYSFIEGDYAIYKIG